MYTTRRAYHSRGNKEILVVPLIAQTGGPLADIARASALWRMFLVTSLVCWFGWGGGPARVLALPHRVGDFVVWNGTRTNMASTTVVVPTAAQLMVCQVGGYKTTAGYFSQGAIRIGGHPLTLVAGDTSTAYWQGVLGYAVLPPPGNQLLTVDWRGSSLATNTWAVRCAYYAEIELMAPVRVTQCRQQGSNPHQTGILTAQAGDLVIAWVFQFVPNVEGTFLWSNATEVSEFPHNEYGDMALAEALPTAPVTITATGTPDSDGGICVMVLKPSMVSQPPPPPPSYNALRVEWVYNGIPMGELFQMERCTPSPSGCPMMPVAAIALGSRDWTDTAIVSSMQYCYRMGVVFQGQVGPYSNTMCSP